MPVPEPPEPSDDFAHLPLLSRDLSFWGMTATQFLGAFNDNLFKQLILLLSIDAARQMAGDYQGLANALFALPFVLFSGFAGWLSDRTSKRRIVVICKVGEIVVMLAGTAAFLVGGLAAPLAVLFLMGSQSAFFGPSKYGILPEMLRTRDLSAANGAIQMTTFLAIIFGAAAAGILKEEFGAQLWTVTAACVGIAVLGTGTAILVRPTAVAAPGLPFDSSSLGIRRDTLRMLAEDRPLLGVLLISSLFWFLGGVMQPTANAFGKIDLQLGDARTSLLMACLAVGIAAGCLLAGRLSAGGIRFQLVTVGAGGIVVCLALLAWLGAGAAVPRASETAGIEDAAGIADAAVEEEQATARGNLLWTESPAELAARVLLAALGVFAGLFVVPLQVFLQARPPRGQKGRMIGTMNLVNWTGIFLSAGFYHLSSVTLARLGHPISWTFAALAVLLLPVAVLYRPLKRDPAGAQALAGDGRD